MVAVAGLALTLPAAAQGGRGGQRGGRGAARDARPLPAGTGAIAGRVLAADTARPIKRARVIISSGGQPRATTTDEQGRFSLTALPAGSYRVTVTKSGYVDGAFGQRRTLSNGTPITLADNQQVTDADVRMARGGVITGHVFDEDGEPLARAIVTVLRTQYARGEKQLAPAGTPDQTDDRGQFRVYGLPPGDYFVSATAGGLERIITQFAQLVAPGAAPEQTADPTGYAPTYYPGVVSATDASRLRLAPSQEMGGINFSIQVVPFATVRGVVSGGPATVFLVSDTGIAAGGGRGGGGRGVGGLGGALLGGQNLRTQTQGDGTFAIPNVTPGKYTIMAGADAGTGEPKVAIQSLLVSGQEVMVALTPVPGIDVTGTITLEAAGSNVPTTLSGFRVNLAPLDSLGAWGRGGRPGDPSPDGRFTLGSVFPGHYAIRASGPRGWMMKSVYLDGRDVTDQTLQVTGETIGGLNVIFTDRISSLAGFVRDRKSLPVEGLTVIAFPQDDRLWHPQSRQIVTARTDKTGAYRFDMVPAGDYFVVAVDDVEPGEWFDPAYLEQVRESAVKVAIGDGEQRAEDLKAPSSS